MILKIYIKYTLEYDILTEDLYWNGKQSSKQRWKIKQKCLYIYSHSLITIIPSLRMSAFGWHGSETIM